MRPPAVNLCASARVLQQGGFSVSRGLHQGGFSCSRGGSASAGAFSRVASALAEALATGIGFSRGPCNRWPCGTSCYADACSPQCMKICAGPVLLASYDVSAALQPASIFLAALKVHHDIAYIGYRQLARCAYASLPAHERTLMRSFMRSSCGPSLP
jgi:hypothetical protein